MKGFIEVTERTCGATVLIAVNEIKSVVVRGGDLVFIETGYDNRREESTGVTVRESYNEVLQKLQDATEVK